MDNQEMKMIISGIIRKEDKKFARVSFLRGQDYAEGIIPDCIIESSKGFDEIELCKLQTYMKENLDYLKSESAKIKPMRNWLGLK